MCRSRAVERPDQRAADEARAAGDQHPRVGKIIRFHGFYHPSTCAKISGATMVASDSMMNLGVFTPSLPQVIFSFGTAPE
jgi:hypothetical protein